MYVREKYLHDFISSTQINKTHKNNSSWIMNDMAPFEFNADKKYNQLNIDIIYDYYEDNEPYNGNLGKSIKAKIEGRNKGAGKSVWVSVKKGIDILCWPINQKIYRENEKLGNSFHKSGKSIL